MSEAPFADVARRIGLVVNTERDAARSVAKETRVFWESRGHEVVEDDWTQPEAYFGDKPVDLAICLGGDGTMLRTVHFATPASVPVLGVNLGTLGYLAGIEPNSIESAFEALERGAYEIDERMTLDITFEDDRGSNSYDALNEAVIERIAPGHTIRVRVDIGGTPFLTYAADGFLVTTPSGSTAYNLSVRGPIVSPRVRAIVLTPIAPHMLFDRSLVIEPEETVEFELLPVREASLVVDGRPITTLQPGQTVTVRAGARPARLVTFDRADFYGVLRAKFNLTDR
ncbi:MAG TPA: NAD(+)/NADH kinase [Acidimicrobiales bacterium]|jgi:NAD+ kinase|nr:NAD(+)/NADH kinase [Acidimicrobiales bacterium]